QPGYSINGPERSGWSGHLPDLVCDADGVARFDDFDPERQFTLRARAPGFGSPDGTVARIDATSRDVELRPAASPDHPPRVPIVADERPVPPDGTIVVLRPRDGSSESDLPRATVDRGELVIAPAPEGWRNVIAETPDGGLAAFDFDARRTERKKVRFTNPRT